MDWLSPQMSLEEDFADSRLECLVGLVSFLELLVSSRMVLTGVSVIRLLLSLESGLDLAHILLSDIFSVVRL